MNLSLSGLVNELRAEGFRGGPPHHLRGDMVLQDIASYADMECDRCGHDKQHVKAFHRGREYRLVCVCAKCGHAVEV